jgi:hypothetical protein
MELSRASAWQSPPGSAQRVDTLADLRTKVQRRTLGDAPEESMEQDISSFRTSCR